MKVLIALRDADCLDAILKFVPKYPWSKEEKTVKLVHFVQPVLYGSLMTFLPSALTEEISRENWKRGTALLHDAAKEIANAMPLPQVKVIEEVSEGIAKLALPETIKEWEPDLLIVGARESRIPKLNSVSLSAAAHANCSVLIVPVVKAGHANS